MKRKYKYIIGIDEAGRGPLAGPVAVGFALVPVDFDWGLVPGVGDSKQVSEKKREEIYKNVKKLEKQGLLRTAVKMGSAKQIDKKGIAVVIRQLIEKVLKDISTRRDLVLIITNPPRTDLGVTPRSVLGGFSETLVKLDGGLRAPAEWVHQETIIKGDAKEKMIGLASIMAKVTRDTYMKRRATLAVYTPYNFAQHKGYGTLAHRQAIARYGLSPEHRVSYCKNIKLL